MSVRYTRNLFLRGMCVIYLFAFLSIYVQIPGLYGDNGILPARTQVDLKVEKPLLQKFMQKPTLLWLAPYIGLNVEYMLDVLALLGVFLSFLGLVSQKFCLAPVFALLWSLYLSIYQVGQTFMWFQWDILLLEAGFLSIIVAPLVYSRKSTPSDSVRLFLVRWLFFRFMFSSGVVKLTSGCPLWWSLDALNVHFESQCIPTPLAWYAHQLPKWYLRLCTVGTFVLEIVIPFLFFFPIKKVQVVAFFLQVLLQIHILLTGNYNFFNLLTILLALSLLDDQIFYGKKSKKEKTKFRNYLTTLICIATYAGVIYGTIIYFNLKITDNWSITSKIGITKEQFEFVLSRAVPISVYIGLAYLGVVILNALYNSIWYMKGTQRKISTTFGTLIYSLIVVIMFSLSLIPYTLSLYPKMNATLPIELKHAYAKSEPLQLANSYGLFRHMTGAEGRPEVIIEGSNNIEGPWKEYNFLYKPGNVNNSLPFVAPHQPRLDWQMWFAALGTYHQNPWIMSLTYRLLNGQPEVLALLNNAENPFRNNPPKYIRASLYKYHYTTMNNKNAQPWWKRERVNDYFPVFSRDHPPLIEYLTKMKLLTDKPQPKVTNSNLKVALDFMRSLVNKVEATVVIWGFFFAGCAIVLTG